MGTELTVPVPIAFEPPVKARALLRIRAAIEIFDHGDQRPNGRWISLEYTRHCRVAWALRCGDCDRNPLNG
jgi:hypothetical protein